MDQEAMSYGIPVIGTDVGGTRECIEDGENGILLRPDFTTDAFVARVSPLLSRPLTQMKRRAYDMYKAKFDADVNRREFVNRVLLKF